MVRRILITLLMPVVLLCQSQQLTLRNFDRESGGPEYIYDLSQDEDGILYIAAGDKVLSFDGHIFNTVYHVEKDGGALTHVLALPSGQLWVATRSGGPFVLKGNRLERIAAVDVSVTELIRHGHHIVFSTREDGIWRADSAMQAEQILKTETAINGIVADGGGNILAATEDGLLVIQKNLQSYKVLNGTPLTAIFASNGNTAWGAGPDGIYKFTKKNGTYRCSSTPASEPALAVSGGLCITSGGNSVWVGTSEGCVRIRIPANGDTVFRSTLVNDNKGLTNGMIMCLLKDREENIWFGSFGEGLFQQPKIQFSLRGKPPGASGTGFYDLLAAGDTAILAGEKSGLWCYDRRTGSWRIIDTGGPVTTIAYGTQKTLWAGTHTGLFIVDRQTGKLKPAPGTEQFGSLDINHLTIHGGKIYAGTTTGLMVYHSSKKIEWLRTDEGLLHNNVRHIFHDSRGRMWISSHGAPPYFIKGGSVTSFKTVKGLQSFKINAVTEDAAGRIWIATDGDGIFSFSNDTFRNYTVADGLTSDYCAAIAAGKNVWVTHRSGLSEMVSGTGYFTSYGKNQGLVSGLSRSGISTDPAAILWFSTPDGLVAYETENQIPAIRTTKIHSVTVDNRPHHPDSAVEKNFGHYTVRIDFLSVSLTNPAAVTYRYRLLGADTSWQQTAERHVVFPQLADGSYTFVVQGVRNGVPLTPDTFILKIQEPVWRQAWFYMLLLAVVAAITYAVVVIRTQAYRRRQVQLELKVKQKTFLLQREKEAVESIKQVLEERNKDITDSIHYAKKIQDSILPPGQQLRSLFGDNYFVYYRPKDIVSGDLYWASVLAPEQADREPLALATVVDCTGHGVPGAFLSIMANDFLRQSIMEPGINMPHEVLDFLNEKISSHLNQTEGSQLQDGMDIAMIGIDYKNNVLYFSGANNPVYIYRKQGDSVDQIILTATKQPIGMMSESTVKFASRAFRLMPGDTIYLFSDGYADQFGGENNKKFTYKRFREVLAEAFELPVSAQKDFLAARFEKWKSDQPQTDDVCVLGIRIS